MGEDFDKETERQSTPANQNQESAHVMVATLMGTSIIALFSPHIPGYSWERVPKDLLSFLGSYWIVCTIAYALFRKK